ncbi:glutamate receptor ionotropic, NMDA 1-like [Actinia tenebrosa]|uniref:Glutamate receptor ionotropic, NMDA 1-like n=1 Tax=Actinia tenebrosa TaxID=6105 RepID=A0A6P8I8Z2_ACTTE|nr:glutamate receptor ionotropic, NMDA 1-like [Actinia tenebrosa]XP_031563700.1 glutamate receptor ionotropic, NMDA 1-like [Actinia tenebrosa]XP_031563701.1 glutamate receptor ionotropic, NMDA 1-like [Actinia tenebrosa]
MKLYKFWIIALLGWIYLQNFTTVQLKAVFRVGVFYDWDFPNGKEYISKLTANTPHGSLSFIRSTPAIDDISNLTIDFVPYSVQDLSLSQITYLFCEKIINEDVSAIVLHTKDTRLTRYLAYLASHLWIPAIGTATNDPSLSDKADYKSFMRTLPSQTLQFNVVLEFFRYIGNAEAFVIVSDDTTHGLALQFFSDINFVTVSIFKIDKMNPQPSVSEYLMRIKASLASAVFLHCDVDLAKHILWSAKDFGVFGEGLFWIVSENIVENTEHSYMLPSGIHAIRVEGLQYTDRFFADRLYNTYEVLHKALNSSTDAELRRFLRKPPTTKCSDMEEWKHGKELYRKLLSASVQSANSVPMRFDAQGDRVSLAYDTLYLQDLDNLEKRWIPTGKWINGKLSLRTSSLKDHGSGEAGLMKLRAAVVEYPPLTMKSTYDPSIGCTQGIICIKYSDDAENYTKHCCYGLAIDVLNYVKVELEFEPFVYFVRDGNYGAKNTTLNKWNGIVHDLIIGEADISIDLMTNEARSEFLDFSQRWTEAGLALLVLVGEKKVDLIDFSFLDPFTMQLWLGIVGTVNMYLVLLWITDRLSPYGYYKNNLRNKPEEGQFNLDGSMWFSWGICFDNQFVNEKPRSYSSRAMAVSLAMFALLCLTSYTANLTAHLLSDDTKPDITGIRDPKLTVESSKLTFGVVKSSYVDNYFELNQDSVMQSLFKRMQRRGHLVQNFTDGVDKVKKRELNVFISEILSLDYEVSKQKNHGYPRLQVVGASKTFADTGYSYSFRKNSSWKPKFNLVINKMKAENKPSELYKKWVRPLKTSSEELHERLNEQSLSGVFFVGVSLAILCIIFLFIETKLYNMGLIYRDSSPSMETYERGRRRFSAEVHRKLFEIRKDKKNQNDATDFPDISNYLERTRKTRASIHALYNPGSIKSKYEESALSSTPTSFV